MFEYNAYQDILAFKSEMIPYLEKEEAVNGLPLGILMNLSERDEPFVMACIRKNEKPCMMLLQTHPRQIIVSVFSTLLENERKEITNLIHQSINHIPGLIGEKEVVFAIAERSALIRNQTVKIGMDQRIYQLKNLRRLPSESGKLRWLVKEDLPIIQNWVYEFSHDVHDPMDRPQAKEKALDILEKGYLAGWEVDGELVSMANATRPTKSNITINFVYTPLEHRKKGYASDCVSDLTQQMLNKGYQTTSLYTDITNPTSNKIYMEIGYEPIRDSILVFFE
ncbi:MAG TPA: GNAT family N-acetyltransferase [Niallia sp.]|nr:GNAT family N-acetyltransferase [Niallia sp.]